MNLLKGRHPGQLRAEAQEAGGNHLAGVPGDREPAEEAGKCSTVQSPISICAAVFQFATIVEPSENVKFQFSFHFNLQF